MMKIRKRWIVLGVIVLAVLSAGGWYWYHTSTGEYKARKLVDELRERYTDSKPSLVQKLLIDWGLTGDKKSRDSDEIRKDLIAIGEPAVPALIRVLKKDKSVIVRVIAIEILGKIGPSAKGVVPALREALKDRDIDVRAEAVTMLGNISPPEKETVLALCEAMKGDENKYFRQWVAMTLGQLGPAAKDAIPALIQVLKNEDDYVRHSAAMALWQIAPDVAVREAVPVLVEDLKAEDGFGGFRAAVVLVDIAPATTAKKTVPVLIMWLEGKFPVSTRRDAANALGRIGPAAKDAIPALREALKDESEDVRQAAAEALKKIEGSPPHVGG